MVRFGCVPLGFRSGYALIGISHIIIKHSLCCTKRNMTKKRSSVKDEAGEGRMCSGGFDGVNLTADIGKMFSY